MTHREDRSFSRPFSFLGSVSHPDQMGTLDPSVLPRISSYKWLLLFSHSVVSDSLWPHGLQHIRLPCPSVFPRVCSNSCPLSQFNFQFSHSVMSDSLWPHELQHAKPPCASPTTGVHPNLCPLSPWYHPTISSSVGPFSSCLQSFPASFPNELALWIKWPKYWSFSIRLSNEYSGLRY